MKDYKPSEIKWKAKLPYIILFYFLIPLLIFGGSYFLFNKLSYSLYLSDKDKLMLERMEKFEKEVKKKFVSQPKVEKILKRYKVEERRNEILSKLNGKGFGLAFFGANKSIWNILSILFVVGVIGGVYFFLFRRFLPKLEREFFFQMYEKERPLKVSKDWHKLDFDYSELSVEDEFLGTRFTVNKKEDIIPLFKSYKHYVAFLGFIENEIITDEKLLKPDEIKELEDKKLPRVKLDYEEMKNDIFNFVKGLTSFALTEGMLDATDEKQVRKFMAVFSLVMLHKIGRYYGGVPTGLLSILIEDYTFKRVLGVYEKKKTIVTSVKGKILVNELEPARFLEIYVRYLKINPEVEDVIDIKYNQLDYRRISERNELLKQKKQTNSSQNL